MTLRAISRKVLGASLREPCVAAAHLLAERCDYAKRLIWICRDFVPDVGEARERREGDLFWVDEDQIYR